MSGRFSISWAAIAICRFSIPVARFRDSSTLSATMIPRRWPITSARKSDPGSGGPGFPLRAHIQCLCEFGGDRPCDLFRRPDRKFRQIRASSGAGRPHSAKVNVPDLSYGGDGVVRLSNAHQRATGHRAPFGKRNICRRSTTRSRSIELASSIFAGSPPRSTPAR